MEVRGHQNKGIQLGMFVGTEIGQSIQDDHLVTCLREERQPIDNCAGDEVGVVFVGENAVFLDHALTIGVSFCVGGGELYLESRASESTGARQCNCRANDGGQRWGWGPAVQLPGQR